MVTDLEQFLAQDGRADEIARAAGDGELGRRVTELAQR